ncbi:MAG: putative Sua5-like translation factor [Bacteriovoracaceae bacterium]|nr:putative Sua5-like translation factor [Bacteriovoracaceae bacterium]
MISQDLDEAKRILLSEGVVAIPTETVYGLAASIRSSQGLEKIFKLKERPLFDPLIVHIHDLSQKDEVVSEWPVIAEILATEFWPGPLTIILSKSTNLNPLITAGLSTVALRMPLHPVAQKLLREVNVPLAAPSANKFGKVSPTLARHVEEEFGEELFVLDGGPSEFGLESTVVRINHDQIEILRPGMITKEKIQDVFMKEKLKVNIVRASSLASPGNLETHYQPKIPLAILSEDTDLVTKLKGKKTVEFILSPDPLITARTLYASLRELSESGAELIFVRRLAAQNGGAWEAIWDRLNRAASLK